MTMTKVQSEAIDLAITSRKNNFFQFINLPDCILLYIMEWISDNLEALLDVPIIRNIARNFLSFSYNGTGTDSDICILYKYRERLITLSKVTDYYFLTKDEALTLKFVRFYVFDALSSPIKLFSYPDVLSFLIKKHGSLANYLQFRQEERKKIIETKERKKQEHK
jgi:hypothetical protein